MATFWNPKQQGVHNNPVRPVKTPVVGGKKSNRRVIINRNGVRIEKK